MPSFVTLKIAITYESESDSQFISEMQRKQSCVIRSAYKGIMAGKSQKEMRLRTKDLNHIDGICSWLQNSAIDAANIMVLADKALNVTTKIFGSKKLFKQRASGKISNEEFKAARLQPLSSAGEAQPHGNRKFIFNVYESNSITFRESAKGRHVKILLPNLRKNLLEKLVNLECHMNECLVPVSIKLTSTHIYITYDEDRVSKVKKMKLKEDRCLGIDLNPNFIGCSIQNKKGDVLSTKMYSLKELTKKSGLPSSDPKSKHLNAKLNHETIESVISVIAFAKSQHVGIIALEDLKFKQGDAYKGVEFNRLTNNVWKRCLFTRILKKYAAREGIKIVFVDPKYTSTIGNIVNNQYPDPIASSIEIGRRGLHGKDHPRIIEKAYLTNLWKEAADWAYEDWVDLHVILHKKNSKVKYRVPVPEGAVFRNMCSARSNISYL